MSAKFYDSPLGPETLCTEHHKLFSKGRITLTRFKNDYQPIDVRKNTEQAYLESLENKK
jgi:hypothetical protein